MDPAWCLPSVSSIPFMKPILLFLGIAAIASPVRAEEAPRPDAAQIDLLKKWIAAGAIWPDGVNLKVPAETN